MNVCEVKAYSVYEPIVRGSQSVVYVSSLDSVVLYRIIPFVAVAGLCAVVPLGTVNDPVPVTATFPVTVKSFPTETFPVTVKSLPTETLAVVTRPVVTLETSIVCGVTFPSAVVFARVWVVATTSTVPSWSVPPTLRFEEVVTPVVTFVKFTVPVTSEPVG
jgi:hypothetical protein